MVIDDDQVVTDITRHRSGSPATDCSNERAAVIQVISSLGVTKLMIRGVSAIAGRMVCIAVMK